MTVMGFWCRSTTDPALNVSKRPDGRKNGYNVHFNLLYDHGANPTLSYVADELSYDAATPEALVDAVMAGFGVKPDDAGAPNPGLTKFREHIVELVGRSATQNENGTWHYTHRNVMAILGWDPREVVYD